MYILPFYCCHLITLSWHTIQVKHLFMWHSLLFRNHLHMWHLEWGTVNSFIIRQSNGIFPLQLITFCISTSTVLEVTFIACLSGLQTNRNIRRHFEFWLLALVSPQTCHILSRINIEINIADIFYIIQNTYDTHRCKKNCKHLCFPLVVFWQDTLLWLAWIF